MSAVPPAPEELDALLRLLDDETLEVRQRVSERLALCGGDISEWIAARPRALSAHEKKILIHLLSQSRRENLSRDWIAPTGGAAALEEDWESFEAILRTLSDFLHDGITLRLSLSDALDLLAEEAADEGVSTALELNSFLFEAKRLIGNAENYHDPRNSDLAWSLAEGSSNPLGLCVIFMLIGHRLGLEVQGVNFPGHFMTRIFEDGYPMIIDCFDKGRIHAQFTLLESPELTRTQRTILKQSVGLSTIIVRLLGNLIHALEEAMRDEDAKLIKELLATLK